MTEPLGCLDGPGTAALRCVLSGFTVAQRRENRVLFAAAMRELAALEAVSARLDAVLALCDDVDGKNGGHIVPPVMFSTALVRSAAGLAAPVEASAGCRFVSGADHCVPSCISVGCLAAPVGETPDERELPEGHPLPWDELRPYEQQQGGYWLYPPGCDVYGNGKFFVRVSRPALPVEEQQR